MTVAPDFGEVGTSWDQTQDLSSVLWRNSDGHANWDTIYGKPGTEPNPAQMQDLLARDGVAAKLNEYITAPIRTAGWSIEPGTGDRGEAALCEAVLTAAPAEGGMSTPIELVVGQMTSAIAYRYAAFEKVYTTEELAGRSLPAPVSLAKVAWRPTTNTRIERDPLSGDLLGLKQWVPWLPNVEQPLRDSQGYVPIPLAKTLLYINAQHRNPLAGSSDLRIAFRCFEIAKRIQFLLLRFLNSRVVPTTVVYGQNGAEVGKQLAGIEQNGILGANADPGSLSFEVLNSGTGSGQSFLDALAWLASEASGSVMAGFTDLTSSSSAGRGSYALASSATDTFFRSLVAKQHEMAACLTNQLLSDIVRFNMPGGVVPQFRFSAPTGLADLVAAIPAMLPLAQAVQAGTFPPSLADAMAQKLADSLNMDVKDIHFTIAQAGAQAAANGNPAEAGVNQLGAETAAAERLMASQQLNNHPTQ